MIGAKWQLEDITEISNREVGSVKLECTGGGKGGIIPAVMPVEYGHPTMTIDVVSHTLTLHFLRKNLSFIMLTCILVP